ncbi:DUF932 domain-containing protein (plasmid) [Streptomyces sp. SDT5-1]|uniref:DUF932 domain-containing protein n=1 Tax=Streptomyces sp. SDT5-1 TaxID=3406418 RepID=UPI003FD270FE
MPDHIEQFTDGTAAFVSAYRSAWHKLGSIRPGLMTAEEVIREAFLGGWNVRKIPLTGTEITTEGAESIEIPDQFASVRNNPKTGRTEYLGVVGNDFKAVQNEDHAEFLNILADESGAHFDTAGSLRGGRKTFVTMKLPHTMLLDGKDRSDWNIAAINAHDGSSKYWVVATPIRVVCDNTARAALQNTPYKFGITHSGNVKEKIAKAREAIGLTFKYAEEFEKAAERMIQAELTLSELRDVVDNVFPMTFDGKIAERNREERWGTISDLFQFADTQANCRGTRWAGYNAITEYVNHLAPARAKTESAKAITRAERVVSGTADASMEKAFSLLTV